MCHLKVKKNTIQFLKVLFFLLWMSSRLKDHSVNRVSCSRVVLATAGAQRSFGKILIGTMSCMWPEAPGTKEPELRETHFTVLLCNFKSHKYFWESKPCTYTQGYYRIVKESCTCFSEIFLLSVDWLSLSLKLAGALIFFKRLQTKSWPLQGAEQD